MADHVVGVELPFWSRGDRMGQRPGGIRRAEPRPCASVCLGRYDIIGVCVAVAFPHSPFEIHDARCRIIGSPGLGAIAQRQSVPCGGGAQRNLVRPAARRRHVILPVDTWMYRKTERPLSFRRISAARPQYFFSV